jgi:hypothetical protein
MTRVRYLIFLSLALVVSGCSSAWVLPETDTLEETLAILPVTPAHIIMPADSQEDYVKMAERANSVLNKLANRNSNKFLGPEKVRKLLDKSELESLYVILGEPGDHARERESKKLSEICKRLEVGKVIRVKVQFLRPQAYEKERKPKSITDNPKQWRGWVDVSADLFSILPPQLIATKTKEKEFSGETGVTCIGGVIACIPVFIPVPYDTYKKFEGRALAEAAHGAIAGLLRQRRGDGWEEHRTNQF